MTEAVKEIILYILNIDKKMVSKEDFSNHLAKYSLEDILTAYSEISRG